MNESELRVIPELRDLQILDPSHPAALSIASEYAACDIAEADDTVRLWDLLHRSEYQVLCGIRSSRGPENRVCVYFRRVGHGETPP